MQISVILHQELLISGNKSCLIFSFRVMVDPESAFGTLGTRQDYETLKRFFH